mgnify:CR=1 FL=1
MFKIYTKNNCNWCVRAKELLKKNNIEYKEINIEESFEDKMVLKSLRLKTVPQIWNEDLHLGGYLQLESWIGENYDSNYINEN